MAELIGMPRAAWRRQPSGWVYPNTSQSIFNPLLVSAVILPSYSINTDAFSGKNYGFSGGDKVATTIGVAVGKSYQANIGSASVVFDLKNCTMIIATVRTASSESTAATNGFGYGYTVRVFAHLPYTDGTVYWDFANGTAGSGRLSVSASTYRTTERVNIWGLVAGSRGREIWLNGVRLANNPSALAVIGSLSTSNPTYLGNIGPNSQEHVTALSLISKEQFSESAMELLTENPWQLFSPAPSRFILIPDSGGTGTSSVYRDGLIRWSILQAIQNDAGLKWDVSVSLENDLLTRWNILTGVLADTALRWHSLAAIQTDTQLRWDVASALFAVQQDAAIRWNVLSTIQQDVITRWNSLAIVEQNAALRWNLLTAVEQDTILRWHTLSRVEQDSLLRWNALQSLSNDQTLRWDVLSNVLSAQNDLALRWDSLSAVEQDALLRWNLATQVEQSLATRWDILNSVEISQAVRWDIAVAVANEILVRWDSAESLTASSDLQLTWNLLAVAENQIELRWSIGDSSLTPGIRIFLVRGEDRTFRVVSEDRTFGVQ